ncbi:hypothetical protein J6590_100362 [Homalodisca vitripennis]|nr:hypothetical protein J6590_100362 [Homalodisca vitripennis]
MERKMSVVKDSQNKPASSAQPDRIFHRRHDLDQTVPRCARTRIQNEERRWLCVRFMDVLAGTSGRLRGRAGQLSHDDDTKPLRTWLFLLMPGKEYEERSGHLLSLPGGKHCGTNLFLQQEMGEEKG